MLKNRVQSSYTIRKDLSDRLRELSEKTKIPMSRLLDEALEDLSEKYKKEGK